MRASDGRKILRMMRQDPQSMAMKAADTGRILPIFGGSWQSAVFLSADVVSDCRQSETSLVD